MKGLSYIRVGKAMISQNHHYGVRWGTVRDSDVAT